MCRAWLIPVPGVSWRSWNVSLSTKRGLLSSSQRRPSSTSLLPQHSGPLTVTHPPWETLFRPRAALAALPCRLPRPHSSVPNVLFLPSCPSQASLPHRSPALSWIVSPRDSGSLSGCVSEASANTALLSVCRSHARSGPEVGSRGQRTLRRTDQVADGWARLLLAGMLCQAASQ